MKIKILKEVEDTMPLNRKDKKLPVDSGDSFSTMGDWDVSSVKGDAEETMGDYINKKDGTLAKPEEDEEAKKEKNKKFASRTFS